MKTILITGCLLLASILPFAAQADELRLNDDAPEVYLVKEGDTLWGISSMYLRDPWLWPEIWEINEQLDNPHLIFPGDEIYLVWVDGRPRLRVRRGDAAYTVKLTPKMRIDPLDRAIPLISLEDIGPWLNGHRVVLPIDLDAAPYVIAGGQRHLLSTPGDRVYVRGSLPEGEVGFGIYRGGQVFVDPGTREVLGVEAADIGSASLNEAHEEDINELEVTRVTEEVRKGDRLLPNESREIAASFQPRAPEKHISGVMLAVDSGVTQIGTLDIVAINLGTRDGAEEGHVLAIYRTGEVVRDEIMNENVQIPDVRAGLLMIFRTFEKMSYGIVLKSNRPLEVMDRVTSP
ncbi:MAG: LysM domain-containing protein [Halieaceae bacterium]